MSGQAPYSAPRLWLDGHLSRKLCPWIAETFAVGCTHISALGLRVTPDPEIFALAGREDAIIVTKDADYAELVRRLGPPPRIIWLTFGNTSNAILKRVMVAQLANALKLLSAGESLVEVHLDPSATS